MWAVVPIKQFDSAKKRLSPLLDAAERSMLAQTMATDVLGALRDSRGVDGVVVVSKDPAAQSLARTFDASFVPETGNELSLAVAEAGRYLASQGVTEMLMVPGDVPLVAPSDIETLIDAHGDAPAVTLVSDRDGTGTNGLCVSPADIIPFAYGINSFQAHHAAAVASGATVSELTLAGLALDIDTPEDIAHLMQESRDCASKRYLMELDIDTRMSSLGDMTRVVCG